MTFPYPGIGDRLYRYYNAWIQTPKLKCGTIDCDVVNATSMSQNMTIEPSGICTYNGTFPIGTVFTFTTTEIPCLANTSCNGELTLYLNDYSGNYSNVTLAYIIKIAGSLSGTSSTISQRYGNFNSVTMSFSGNTVRITVDPECVCRWIYRGV